jgi:hypothetical protein
MINLIDNFRAPWTGDQLNARPLPAEDNIDTRKNADIHASSVIRNHDPSSWTAENITYLSPRENCDRLLNISRHKNNFVTAY